METKYINEINSADSDRLLIDLIPLNERERILERHKKIGEEIADKVWKKNKHILFNSLFN